MSKVGIPSQCRVFDYGIDERDNSTSVSTENMCHSGVCQALRDKLRNSCLDLCGGSACREGARGDLGRGLMSVISNVRKLKGICGRGQLTTLDHRELAGTV